MRKRPFVSGTFQRLKDLFSLSQEKNDSNESDFWALNKISFDVKAGEIIGIIGRNGAGKSTLLKILSRITNPTNGFVHINGRMASLLEVGTGFHPELSGRENIFLNGAILGMSKIEIREKFDEIVAFADTEKFLETPVKYYSSGMYVRLAFSVAAHLNPEILVVDEVLSVGDTAFQKKCMGKMEGISNSGKTILLVSHTLSTIRQLCQRTLVIDQGRIFFDGPTSLALSQYHRLLRAQKIDSESSFGERLISHSGAVRFLSLSVHDAEDRETYEFKTGETIRIQFTYRAYEDVPNLIVRIAYRSLGNDETVTNSEHILSDVPVKAGTVKRVTIEYANITLCPKEYSLYLWMADRNGNAFDRIDYTQNSCPFICITSEDMPENMEHGYFQMPSRLLPGTASY